MLQTQSSRINSARKSSIMSHSISLFLLLLHTLNVTVYLNCTSTSSSVSNLYSINCLAGNKELNSYFGLQTRLQDLNQSWWGSAVRLLCFQYFNRLESCWLEGKGGLVMSCKMGLEYCGKLEGSGSANVWVLVESVGMIRAIQMSTLVSVHLETHRVLSLVTREALVCISIPYVTLVYYGLLLFITCSSISGRVIHYSLRLCST